MKSTLLVLLVLLLPLAYAETQGSEIEQQGVAAAARIGQCKTEFSITTLQAVITEIPATSAALQPHVSKLEADAQQMQGMSKEGLREFVRSTLDPDLRAARQAVIDSRPLMRNASRDAMVRVRDAAQDAKAEHDTCVIEGFRQLSNVRIQAYSSILDNHQRRADRLKEQGIDTSGLDSIITDAREDVIAPLQAAVSAAKGGQELRAAMESYCLFDGCKDGLNYHFGAKFEVARTQIALDYAKAQWNLTDAQAAEAQAEIDAAQSALEAIGTGQHTQQSAKTIDESLRAAVSRLKQARPKVQG